ncbi:MAG: hypothetical protein EXR65_05780, partial [Dehalococcoidia bacterium]|nr:hypothetical protein [Dehalococcoidia bacterium]
MNVRHDLPAIVDRCLDDLATGRATVADCLARYPQHRAALEPLLTAAAAVRRTPRPAERAVDPARRARFVALLRATPQQRPRGLRLPSLAPFALSYGLFPRLAAAGAPLAVAVVLGIALLVGQPATPAAASTLTVFGGGVEVQVGEAWSPLADGARLSAGARLRTTAEGRALITFPDGSTSALDPATEIALEWITAGGPRVVRIRQFSGRLWNDVVTDRRLGATYEVHTVDAIAQVHGTVFETTINNGQTVVSAADGDVDVIAGSERVSVTRGQLVRAQAQKVAERAAVRAAGSLTIYAPFAAALLAPGGEATGARADGAVFRQIRGVTTSNPGDGPQRLDFQRLDPGVYTLLLRRFGEGAGDLVLESDGVEHRITLDGDTGTARAQVRVTLHDGQPAIELIEDRPQRVQAERDDPVRVVETERTRNAAGLAVQRERSEQERERARPTPPPARLVDPAVDAFTRGLRDALAGGDAAAIRERLNEIVAAQDTATVQARLLVLAALAASDEAASRIARALAGDAHAALRARLVEASDTLAPAEVRARLRRALLGEAIRVLAATPAGTTPPTPVQAAAEAFSRGLRDALSRNDPAAIRERLSDVLAPQDTATVRARLQMLAALVADDDAANRVTRALAGDAHAALRTRLVQAAETLAPAEP